MMKRIAFILLCWVCMSQNAIATTPTYRSNIPDIDNAIVDDAPKIQENFEYLKDLLLAIGDNGTWDDGDPTAYQLPDYSAVAAEGVVFLASDNSTSVVGYDAEDILTEGQTGQYNSYFGYNTGGGTSLGGNTLLGSNIYFAAPGGASSGNVAIGRGITIDAGADNRLIIDNGMGGYASPLIEGTFAAAIADRDITLNAPVTVESDLICSDDLVVGGDVQIDGDLAVTGEITAGSYDLTAGTVALSSDAITTTNKLTITEPAGSPAATELLKVINTGPTPDHVPLVIKNDSVTMDAGNSISGYNGMIITNLESTVGTAIGVTSNGKVVKISSSSKKYKKNIKSYTPSGDVFDLTPVTFTFKQSGADSFGFIAEDVNTILPELVYLDKEGQPDSVHYQLLSVILLEKMREMQADIEALEKKQAEKGK